MNKRVFAVGQALALLALLAGGPAWGRNPNCAGGIQYLTQALNDKQKGNTEDYEREIGKAVQRLEMCASEDPNDYEAMGYLGWAYAEVDSMGPAGAAFQKSIDGLSAKGDKKKLELVTNNRESFWATAFNQGIAKVSAAQTLFNPFTNEPENDLEKAAKDAARKNYEEALGSLDRALALKPGDPRTLRNIGAVYGFMGDFERAEQYFRQGLASAPGDSDLTAALRSARTNRATQLIKEKKLDEAIAYFKELLKDEPKDGDLWAGLGDANFAKARGLQGDARKPVFMDAAVAYAKAASLRPDSPELPFNAAICYQNGGDPVAAEAQWRNVLKIHPEDREAMTELSSVLADQKKFPEAITTAQKALVMDPKDKNAYRQLGSIYNKAGDNLHSKQYLLAYLALDKGSVVDAATDASGAAGARLLPTLGKPDQIVLWEADNQNYESWFYWAKGLAFHFGGGSQLEKTDWSSALAAK